MKKLIKFFLFTLFSRFLSLGLTYAQNASSTNNTIYDKYESSWNNTASAWDSPRGQESFDGPCLCAINMLGYLLSLSLFLIKILLGIIIIITSLKTISLYKNFVNTYKCARLFNIPIINLYPLSKISIGRIRFYILILLLGFFIYSTYTDKAGCCYKPTRQRGAGIIAGIFSIIILGFLLSKISYLMKPSQKESNKESPNK